MIRNFRRKEKIKRVYHSVPVSNPRFLVLWEGIIFRFWLSKTRAAGNGFLSKEKLRRYGTRIFTLHTYRGVVNLISILQIEVGRGL